MGSTIKTGKIGIVLAKMPGYSETFLRSKIQGLTDEGFDVTVFFNHGPYDPSLRARQVRGFFLPNSIFLRVPMLFIIFIGLLARCPRRVVRFLKLESRRAGNVTEKMKNIFTAAHILPYTLDRLHFGFSTMAVGRENIAKAMEARMSVSFRGYDISIYPLQNPGVYNLLWTRIDKVHTISDDLYNQALRLGLPPDVQVVKITPAVDLSKFNFHRAKVSNGKVRIITVARLEWKKGLEVGIDAMRILKDRDLSFSYTIVGDGSDKERLLYARHQNNLAEEIEFTGQKSHEEVIALMSNSDIYLQPSLQEGFCNSVLEAQACGLSCIVTNAEGLSENVGYGKNGIIVSRWNPDEIANAILKITNLPEQVLRENGEIARERVYTQYNLGKQQQLFSEFFAS